MLTNKEFYTRPAMYNKILKQYNSKYYLVEEKDLLTGDVRSDILLTPDEIKTYLDNQDSIIIKVQKAIEYHKKALEAERLEQEKQEAIEREYNNTYGYTDNMTPMQKGKVLKILNKKENYYDSGKYIETMARKDFIKIKLDNGYTLEHKKDIKYYAKNYELKTKENEYRLVEKEGTFYEITKTEYDYAKYLINKQLQKVV